MNAPSVPGRIRGLDLRRLLTDMLVHSQRPMTIAELERRCDEIGVPWGAGRPSKIISDALRWEVGRGRVVRVGRSLYRVGEPPRTTRWRIHTEARAIRQRLAAVRRDDDPAGP